MKLRLLALIGLLCFGIAGCAAKPNWRHDEIPQSRWDDDYLACRRWAETQAGVDPRMEDRGGPIASHAADQAKKRVSAYLGSCMIDKGYQPIRR